jgi:hypothetical protein
MSFLGEGLKVATQSILKTRTSVIEEKYSELYDGRKNVDQIRISRTDDFTRSKPKPVEVNFTGMNDKMKQFFVSKKEVISNNSHNLNISKLDSELAKTSISWNNINSYRLKYGGDTLAGRRLSQHIHHSTFHNHGDKADSGKDDNFLTEYTKNRQSEIKKSFGYLDARDFRQNFSKPEQTRPPLVTDYREIISKGKIIWTKICQITTLKEKKLKPIHMLLHSYRSFRASTKDRIWPIKVRLFGRESNVEIAIGFHMVPD